MKYVIPLLILICILTSCAPISYVYHPVIGTENYQTIRYDRGHPAIISYPQSTTGLMLETLRAHWTNDPRRGKPAGRSFDVYVQGYENAGGVLVRSLTSTWSGIAASASRQGHNIILNIAYGNMSEESINALPTEIMATGCTPSGSPTILPVYDAQTYLAKLRKKQNRSLFLSAFSGALDAMDAGKSTSYTTGSIYAPYGSLYGQTQTGPIYTPSGSLFTLQTETTTYDYGKELAARRDLENKLARQVSGNTYMILRTSQRLLRDQTLSPGQYIEGDVMIRLRGCPDERIIFKVPFGGYTHTLEFRKAPP